MARRGNERYPVRERESVCVCVVVSLVATYTTTLLVSSLTAIERVNTSDQVGHLTAALG